MLHKGAFFRKYLGSVILTLLTSLLILYHMSMLFFNNYWSDEKKNLLHKNAKVAAAIVRENIDRKSIYTFKLRNFEEVQKSLDVFAVSANIDIIVTDYYGRLIIGSTDPAIDNIPHNITDKTISEASYFSSVSLKSEENGNYYLFGIPISDDNHDTLGLVYTLIDSNEISKYTNEVNKIFLFASLISVILASFTALILSKKITKPINEIHKTAKLFGQGQLSERIQNVSNDELGDLAQTFNNMAESLQNFEVARRSFISNLSHELRTPMTTISGFVDGILDGTISEEKQKHYLGIVSNETKRLSRLIKSMRNLTKVDNGSLMINPTNFSINDIIESVYSIFSQDIANKGINFSFNDGARKKAFADHDMIFQIIYNLIENAVKFTPKDGFIEIISFDDKNYIQVSVKNSGNGISPEDIPFIFDKFYKVDKSRSVDKDGMGLGLYLSKVMAEMNGGTIDVDSIYGEYCEFKLTIKATKAINTKYFTNPIT